MGDINSKQALSLIVLNKITMILGVAAMSLGGPHFLPLYFQGPQRKEAKRHRTVFESKNSKICSVDSLISLQQCSLFAANSTPPLDPPPNWLTAAVVGSLAPITIGQHWCTILPNLICGSINYKRRSPFPDSDKSCYIHMLSLASGC